jgi:hypothetical protein
MDDSRHAAGAAATDLTAADLGPARWIGSATGDGWVPQVGTGNPAIQ